MRARNRQSAVPLFGSDGLFWEVLQAYYPHYGAFPCRTPIHCMECWTFFYRPQHARAQCSLGLPLGVRVNGALIHGRPNNETSEYA
jgi:hypothetical protein